MRTIEVTYSLDAFLDEMVFSQAALLARGETKSLADTITQKMGEWEEQQQNERQSRHELIRTNAVVKVVDQELDECTMMFGQAVLLAANRDRESLLYRRFFPQSPSVYTRQPLNQQAADTLSRIVPELEKLPDASALKAYLTPLRTAAENVRQALSNRDQADAHRTAVAHDVEAWKSSVNNLRLGVYAQLMTLAADSGKAKDWADMFFRTERSTSSEKPAKPTIQS